MRRSLYLREASDKLELPYTFQILSAIPFEKREMRLKLGKITAGFLKEMADEMEGEAIATFIAAERVSRTPEIGAATPSQTKEGAEKIVQTLSDGIGDRENVGPNHGVPQETEA